MELTHNDDEHLEALWLLDEKGLTDRDSLINRLGEQFDDAVLVKLGKDKMIKGLVLTPQGREYTNRLIRAHRLAERLLNDVLGINDYEVGACEFEHIMNHEILDGLCTLLGHPTLCPHGLPIPPGECCRRGESRVNQAVHALSTLNAGDKLKILYIQTENDRELHILEGMRIRPGMTVTVHQTRPALVIESEGTHIAMDESIAEKILGLSQLEQSLFRENICENHPMSGHRRGLGRGRGGRHWGRRHGNRNL